MMLQDIIYISVICSICCFPAAVVGCPTTIQGWTYELHAGEYLSIPDIGSVSLCESECLASSFCQAFTYEENQPVSYCYLYARLSPLIACHDCTTSTITRIRSGVGCLNNEDDEIKVVMTESVDQCLSSCQSHDLCTHFVWFNHQATIPHHCFLFSSDCEAFTDCAHCQSGTLQCLTQPQPTSTATTLSTSQPSTDTSTPTTQNAASTTVAEGAVSCLNSSYYDHVRTAPSPTTLRGSVPVECEDHQILDDYTRNSKCGFLDHSPYYYSDNDRYTSPDWKGGDQWYRFVPPAGLVIPESAVQMYHCGTEATGWLNDVHPQQEGESKEAEVCFSANRGGHPEYDCVYSKQIEITNCDNFFVYRLPEIEVYYYRRYCGADTF